MFLTNNSPALCFLTLCIKIRQNNLYLSSLPRISANFNKNYRPYNFQALANISGKFTTLIRIQLTPSRRARLINSGKVEGTHRRSTIFSLRSALFFLKQADDLFSFLVVGLKTQTKTAKLAITTLQIYPAQQKNPPKFDSCSAWGALAYLRPKIIS